MSRLSHCVLPAALALIGCGGSTPPPDEPSESSVDWTDPGPPSDNDSDTDEPSASATDSDADDDTSDHPDKKASGEPEFPEDATVDQAIAAIPPGVERVNVEQDVLAEPLQKPEVYEPCKVGGQHFKLKVAVWNGHAVGIDVDTKNAALASCVKEQVRALKWAKKVRSLNTIEFGL